MLVCIFLGFTSGMPLYVLIQLVPAWLRVEGVDLSTIGLFSLVALPYTWKFLWSPLLDRFSVPGLGRRRGWMLLTQVGLLFSIGALGHFNPEFSLTAAVVLVFAVTVFSATQDIVIDAYRRELLPDDELGTGNSIFVNAYRLSSLVPGSLALILSDHMPWATVFWITGGFMLVGIVTTLFIREVVTDAEAPRSLREAVVEPFVEFVGRAGWGTAALVLLFILLYKLGDNMATALATPFYLDMGFSRTEIGTIAKVATLWSSIAGSVIGGIVMLKVSINRALWLFGVVQITSILGFAWLAQVGQPGALADGVLLEEAVDFTRELAVLVARSPSGQAAAWPVVETVQTGGICTEVLAPAPGLDDDLARAATEGALRIAGELGVTGVLAVEMFEVRGQDGRPGYVVNELAMRPHNSGHWTIEGAVTSQFEQHLRAVLDLPLGDPSARSGWTVMANVLGGEHPDLYPTYRHLMARDPGLKIHLYGKGVRPGRKLGHVTVFGDDLDPDALPALRERARHAADYLQGVVTE